MRTPKHLADPSYKRQVLGHTTRPRPKPPNKRVIFLETSVSIWGWPSRGGLIVLEHAGPLDFDHLGLDRFQTKFCRSNSQEDEDAFCKQLLRLGARWFDSRERYGFVVNVHDGCEPEHDAIENDDEPPPSSMERRWVSVGFEKDGFWVLEYDRVIYYAEEPNNTAPWDVAQLTLAKTMEEKCEMLKRRGASFYQKAGDYRGLACINSWETKSTGEFGPLASYKWVVDSRPATTLDEKSLP